MKRIHATALERLGYNPQKCAEIGHRELGRHAVFASGDEIIKFYGSDRGVSAEARAKAEWKYSALARERGVNAPVTLRIGEVAGIHYTVSERLPGSPVPADAGSEIWREIGRLLGAFHAPGLDDGVPWLEKWRSHCLECAHAALKNPCGDRAAHAIDAAASWLEGAARPKRFTLLPMGSCHGDFYPRNVLCEGGRVTGVIDFELAFDGNVELELAHLSRAGLAVQPDLAVAFQAGYRESAYLAPDFKVRLPVYLVGQALCDLSWSFDAVPDHFQSLVDMLARFLA